jgi:hypothetical protein
MVRLLAPTSRESWRLGRVILEGNPPIVAGEADVADLPESDPGGLALGNRIETLVGAAPRDVAQEAIRPEGIAQSAALGLDLPEQQENDQDQEDEASSAAAPVRAACVPAAEASEEQQDDEDHDDEVHVVHETSFFHGASGTTLGVGSGSGSAGPFQ